MKNYSLYFSYTKKKLFLLAAGTFFLFIAATVYYFGKNNFDLTSIKISVENDCITCYNFFLRAYKNFVGNEFKTYYFYIFIAVAFLAEFIIPVRKSQKRFSVGFYHDFVWFLVNIFFFSVLISFYWIFLKGAYSNYFSFLRVDFISHLPAAIQIVTVILIGDFLGWFHHYVRHKVPLFWYFHSIHHSQKEMNMFTDYRVHFVEYIIAFTIRFIPILSLTQSVIYPTALGWILFNRWHTRIYHANLKTNYGILRYIFVTPQSHRIHHSTERRHYDKNFGVLFSFWDRLFKTQYKIYDEYPEETGVKEETFPHESEIKLSSLIFTPIRQMIYPFQVIRTNLNKKGKLFKW